MRVRAAAAAIMVLAGLAAVPGAAAAAGWDTTPLPLSATSDTSPTLGPVVETTDDGAAWVAWTDGQGSGPSQVVVRRIGPDGIPGAERVLTATGPGYNGAIALAPLPGGELRVAYITALGATLEERRLTPTATGDPVVLYDKATTDDGNAGDNGNVFAGSVKALAAPDGASWISFIRANGLGPSELVSARRIAGDESVGPLAAVTQPAYEADTAVDPSGRLIIAMAWGPQARTVLVPVDTDGLVGPEVEIRASDPPSPPFAASNTPAIAVDAAGIATVGWRLDTPTARYIEVRRVDTTTMTPQGTGPTAVNDDLPTDFVQYGPLLGADAGGAVVMGWYETDSNQSNNDAMVRVLGDGALADTGVIGARTQLDGPSPEGGSVSDLVPGPGGIVTAFFYTDQRACGAPRIDTASGDVLSAGAISSGGGCAAPVGPANGANGVVATWTDYPSWRVMLSRYVTAAPACSDGGPVTVVAGASVALSLPCTGWRPARQITGAPARGTLGAVDDSAGTVTYTAGAQGGSDLVRFRATNGAGQSDERSVAITVTPPPETPGGPSSPPPPPDTSDRTPPVLSRVSLKPRRVRKGRARAPVLGLSLSEPARVRVAVQRCKNRRCTKLRTRRSVVATVAAGRAKLKLNVRRLPAGRYRVSVTATDAAGNISAAVRVSLIIERR
jgi:hypothetical protein